MPGSMTIPARSEAIVVREAVPILRGCMQRFIIDKNVEALREFHRLGIPLDHALDFAVQKGNMQMIDELLNNFGISPSETTLLRAMRRGVTIRNMFLNQVAPTVRHLNGVVQAENFDTALLLLDRGIAPTFETVAVLKGTAKQTSERREFINRLIAGLSDDVLSHPSTPKKTIAWTTVAQFERVLERLDQIPTHRLNDWLAESLHCAAPGHARVLLNRGATFTRDLMDISGYGAWSRTDHNPEHDFEPVLRAVLETAIDENVLYEEAEKCEWLTRSLVSRYAFAHPARFSSLCELLSRACTEEIRPQVARSLVAHASNKQRRQPMIYTLQQVNDLEDDIRPMFLRAPANVLTDAPGCSP